jgi:hypothetical protein
MGFSLKNIFKGAAVAATGFVASKYLGPTGSKLAARAVGTLMGKSSGEGGGGNWQPTDTSVSAPSFSGNQMGFVKADSAGTNSGIKTANADQLRDEWDYRLSKWFKNKDEMFG